MGGMNTLLTSLKSKNLLDGNTNFNYFLRINFIGTSYIISK